MLGNSFAAAIAANDQSVTAASSKKIDDQVSVLLHLNIFQLSGRGPLNG